MHRGVAQHGSVGEDHHRNGGIERLAGQDALGDLAHGALDQIEIEMAAGVADVEDRPEGPHRRAEMPFLAEIGDERCPG